MHGLMTASEIPPRAGQMEEPHRETSFSDQSDLFDNPANGIAFDAEISRVGNIQHPSAFEERSDTRAWLDQRGRDWLHG